MLNNVARKRYLTAEGIWEGELLKISSTLFLYLVSNHTLIHILCVCRFGDFLKPEFEGLGANAFVLFFVCYLFCIMIIPCAILFSLILCADNAPNYQRLLMHQILYTKKRHGWDYRTSGFILNHRYSANECLWKGVECQKGVMTGLVLNSSITRRLALRMPYLPSTLKFVHLHLLALESSWKAPQLPRELRYLYMNQCFLPRPESIPAEIELESLPARMEEYHHIHGWWFGPVNIIRVPRRMRILEIIHEKVTLVTISNDALPPSLELVYIRSLHYGVRPKLREVLGRRVDSRVQTDGNSEIALSPLYRKYDAIDAKYRESV